MTVGSTERATPVLDPRALNRATLARQHLLTRAGLPVPAALEAVGGLQAQEPASPYLALWTRLEGFAPAGLDGAFERREVVKGTLMRGTLHAVSAADYGRLAPAVLPRARGIRRTDRGTVPTEAELARLLDAAAAYATEPRSLQELQAHLARIDPARSPEELVWWLWRFAPLLRAPEPGMPWSFGRRPRLVHAAAWLPDLVLADDAASTAATIRTHLGAFGPASAADISAWSGIPVGTLRPTIDALVATGEVERLRSDTGRELLDLPDAPRPDPDTDAPPRLLPMWDSVLLAHADRTRIISDADRAIVVARNGDTLPTFLVDGVVAGLWWTEPGSAGRTAIHLEPFRPIPGAARRALEAEADRLRSVIEPIEPFVYRRYQRWRPTPGAPASIVD